MLLCCNDSSSFWDIKISDFLTFVIAVINVLLLLYIFIYQRSKDKSDRKLIISQINLNVKLELFKLLIIEPNINAIYSFFKSIFSELNVFNDSQNIINSKVSVTEKINEHFNNFEYEFIALLKSVDEPFHDKNLLELDSLRDVIVLKIDSLVNFDNEAKQDFDKSIDTARNTLLSNLYNFKPEIIPDF